MNVAARAVRMIDAELVAFKTYLNGLNEEELKRVALELFVYLRDARSQVKDNSPIQENDVLISRNNLFV